MHSESEEIGGDNENGSLFVQIETIMEEFGRFHTHVLPFDYLTFVLFLIESLSKCQVKVNIAQRK